MSDVTVLKLHQLTYLQLIYQLLSCGNERVEQLLAANVAVDTWGAFEPTRLVQAIDATIVILLDDLPRETDREPLLHFRKLLPGYQADVALAIQNNNASVHGQLENILFRFRNATVRANISTIRYHHRITKYLHAGDCPACPTKSTDFYLNPGEF